MKLTKLLGNMRLYSFFTVSNLWFVFRVLQLTSYDEEQSELDNLTVLKKLQNAIQNKLNAAHDWLMVILIIYCLFFN